MAVNVLKNEDCVYFKRSLKSVYPSFFHMKSSGSDAGTYILTCLFMIVKLVSDPEEKTQAAVLVPGH